MQVFRHCACGSSQSISGFVVVASSSRIAISDRQVCDYCDFELQGCSLCTLRPRVCTYCTLPAKLVVIALSSIRLMGASISKVGLVSTSLVGSTKRFVRKRLHQAQTTSAELANSRNSGDPFPIVPSSLTQATLPEQSGQPYLTYKTRTQHAMPEDRIQHTTHTHTVPVFHKSTLGQCQYKHNWRTALKIKTRSHKD